MTISRILLWKAVVFEVGVHGLQAHPKMFWFAENLGKSPENPGKNGTQRCLTSKNGAQGLHKNTWIPFSGGYTKKRFSWFCGRKFVGKSCTKTFWASLGKFGKNPSHPKNLPVPTPMIKRHLRPRCPSFERAEREIPSPRLHSLASLCMLFYTHSLYSLL